MIRLRLESVLWSVSLLLANSFCISDARIFTRCEFVDEAREYFPEAELDKWACIAQFESHFNTAAISSGNKDKSRDHGILQINDRYWCSPGKHNICEVSCEELRSENLTQTFKCAGIILAQQGFRAWTVYPKYCMNTTGSIDECGNAELSISQEDTRGTSAAPKSATFP